ncbi:hypothetical protein ALQ56_03903 [Pseudomonas syringae pv. papulans]|nr:hypothetical protein ALQ56_03903 [Pseudomonas syringae pv. papulans]
MRFSGKAQEFLSQWRYKLVSASLQELIYCDFPVRERRSNFYLTASKDLDAFIQSADVPVSKPQCLLDRIRMNILRAQAHHRHCMCFLDPSIKDLLLTPCRRKAFFEAHFQRYKPSFPITHGPQSSITGGKSV